MRRLLSLFIVVFTMVFSASMVFSIKTVEVYPKNEKQSTGLYIKTGETLTIDVAGKWSLWDKYTAIDADGHSFTANEYGNWGKLVGQIDNGPIFVIGKGAEIVAKNDGILYLFPNKGKYLIENPSGKLEAEITGGTPLEDFITNNLSNAIKIDFNPDKGIVSTDLYVKEGEPLKIYAFGQWTMWDGVYPVVNPNGHEFKANGVPWGKLYGGIGSSYGQFTETFSIGEYNEVTPTRSGILSLFPYVGNYVSVKKGDMQIYIIGGKKATDDDKKQINEIVQKSAQSITLDVLNEIRKNVGVSVLEVNPLLSTSAFNHSKYMIVNDTFDRKEEDGKPNYSATTLEERVQKLGYSGKVREMFVQTDSSINAINLFFSTVYHRLRLLNPDLKYVGYGAYRLGDKTIHVFDFGYAETENTDWEKIVYPISGSQNIPIQWDGNEEPDPFPVGAVKPLGYPVSIMFREQLNKVIEAKLVNDKGEDVPCYLITPETDINNKSINAIVLVSKKVLEDNTRYTASVKVKLGDAEETKEYSWSFTTEVKIAE